jgi:hypothetical protein
MTLTSGPHLLAAGRKRKGGRVVLGRRKKRSWAGLLCVRERPTARVGLRLRKEGGRELGQLEENDEGEKAKGFYFKILFKFIFKLSIFTQTRNHAFES